MEPGKFWRKKFESAWTKDLEQPFFHIKSSENISVFKCLMKNWNGNSCSCTGCTKKIIHWFYFSIMNFITDIILHRRIISYKTLPTEKDLFY